MNPFFLFKRSNPAPSGQNIAPSDHLRMRGLMASVCAAIAFTGSAFGVPYLATMEAESELKPSYASGTVNLSGIDWDLTDSLIGNLDADFKIGAKSIRMRGYATTAITMIADKPDGAGVFSFSYRRYGTDAQQPYVVEYSSNSGTSWVQIGAEFTPPTTDDISTFSAAVNVFGNVRFRIRCIGLGTVNKRMNIDDIQITDPSGSDVDPPTLAVTNPLSPAAGATGVSDVTSLTISFSEPVKAVSGNVLLYREAGATDVLLKTFPASSIVDGSSVLSFSLEADPAVTLSPLTTYYVVVEPTAFEDNAGNDFPGLAAGAWQFTTAPADIISPVPTLFPADGNTSFLQTASLTLTYNEPVILNTTGTILLKKTDGTTVETFDLATTTRVTLDENTLTIDPTAVLDLSTGYYVEVPAGIVKDTSNNLSAAITGSSAWNFTTRGTPSLVISQYYEGTGENRYIELQNLTGAPLSLDGYHLTAWSGTGEPGNQIWKTANLENDRVTPLDGFTIPANGSFLVAAGLASGPGYAVNNNDVMPLFPAATSVSGNGSIVLYSATGSNPAAVVDAISIVGTEGTDTSYYRIANETGFDLTPGTSIQDYPTVWAVKTIAEVDNAAPTDDWFLESSVPGQPLTLSFSPSTFLENAGEEVSTGTVTRAGATTEEAVITIVGSDESEVFVPFSVVIPSGASSATFLIDAIDDALPDGSKSVSITVSGPGYYNAVSTVTVQDDGDGPINVVINEVDSNTPGTDVAEFIELYNNSDTPESLEGLVIVLCNGGVADDPLNPNPIPNDVVYGTIALTGTIAPHGFYVIGNDAVPNINQRINNGLIQNGADGIALCMGIPSEFPNGTAVANLGSALLDAVVYSLNNTVDASLVAALTPGSIQANETSDDTLSLARRPDGGAAFDSSLYVAQTPTPGTTNVITPPTDGYATWAATNAGGQGINGDFDNDGVKNGLEYFFGATGSTFTPNPGVVAGKIKWPTAGVTDLDYAVQTSTDLVIWNDVTPDLSETGFINYTLPASTPGTPKLFVRFLIETLEP